MARVFARLKLRLLKNRLKKSNVIQVFGFIVSWLLAIGIGIGVGFGYGAAVRAVPNHLAISGLFFTLAFLAWLLLPIVAATLDDTVEARQFELLPFNSRQLSRGLLVAAFVGPGALLTVLVFGIGIGVGYGFDWQWPFQMGAALMGLAFMVAVSRWITTMITDLLRNRRTQEVAALVVVAMFTLPAFISSQLLVRNTDLDPDAIIDAIEPLTWTPPGVFGRLVDAIDSGNLGEVALSFLYGTVMLLGAMWLFSWSVDRLQTRASINRRTRRRRGGNTRLYPRRYPLPRTPVGSVAAKELKYLFRDSRVKAQLMGGGGRDNCGGWNRRSGVVGHTIRSFCCRLYRIPRHGLGDPQPVRF